MWSGPKASGRDKQETGEEAVQAGGELKTKSVLPMGAVDEGKEED